MTIIGAGPAGLLAALRLKLSNNITPVIYEIRDVPTTLGGAIAIPSNGLRLLHRLGVYDKLLARGALTPKIVLHSIEGKIVGEMDAVSWSKEKTGFSYLRIRRTDIVDALIEVVTDAGIPIHFGKRLEAISEDESGVTAKFADGTVETSDFLLGCDGIHSAVRKLYVDPEITPTYTGIATLYSLVDTHQLREEFSSLANLNATLGTPAGNNWANTGKTNWNTAFPGNSAMSPQAVGNVGGSQPHTNMMPYLVLNFCIALQGIFPSQT